MECVFYLDLIISVFGPRFLTHTVLLLDELHQLLQDLIQNPADRRREAGSAGNSLFLLA